MSDETPPETPSESTPPAAADPTQPDVPHAAAPEPTAPTAPIATSAPPAAGAPAAPATTPRERRTVAVPMSLLIAIAVLIGAAVMFGIGYAVGDSGGSNSATSPAGAQVPNTPFTPRTTPNDGGTQQSPSPTAGSGAFLGVATQPASTGNGVEVTQVVPDSGADNTELQVGDVITTFDGQRVSTPAQLGTAVAAKQSGDKVEVTFTRDGQSRTATVTLGTRGTTNN